MASTRKPPKGVAKAAGRLKSYGKQAAKQPGYLGSMARGGKPASSGGRVGMKPPKKR